MSSPLACMADLDFENPTFDPDGHGIDNDKSFDLPDVIMDQLPLRVQQELYTSGDLIQSLQCELREVELETQKKRLVDTFHNEVTQVGCAPTVSTMTSSGSMPTAKRTTGRLATKRS